MGKEVQGLLGEATKQFVAAVTPQRKGSQLVLTVKEKDLTEPLARLTRRAQTTAQQQLVMNHLKQIGLAMHNYLDANGHFPTPFSVDKQKKPLLSWRVHLLPYLEQQNLYRQFRLDEPWDSEHNKKLIKLMPKIFQCPLYPELAKQWKDSLRGSRRSRDPVSPGQGNQSQSGG